jgi:hypothetical protein
MKLSRKPTAASEAEGETVKSPLALEKVEKGSNRSMWELLLQLRVLLPYLSHVIPLLERNTGLKASTELVEISRGIAGIEVGSRELETLARNQALQLERIDEQVGRLWTALEVHIEENQRFANQMRSFRRLMVTMTFVIFVLLGATAGMMAYLLLRP